ncbi:ParB N-terminal domain-containing protein, partial [Roseburia hominis]|nr:ParB N-terminal domain-containing protein [Roseburia hominis]
MLKLDDLVVDKEFDELLPVLTLEEFERLEQSILKNGMLDPIKVWEEPGTGRYIIIDGHNRCRILKKHNIGLKYWEDYKIMYADELPDRDAVKQWMLEQQLGRRNLSDTERYEIVQKFKSVFEKKAKENQSSGGKGLTNLSKVNTRKEMAKAVGVSEGTYQKIDKVMQSDNEELKQQLRDKKVSVDRAYKEVKNTNQAKPITPEKQIDKLDKRINEIDKSIESLQTEKKEIMQKRSSIFEGLEIKCPVKYRWVNNEGTSPWSWECQIYIENNGQEDVFGNYSTFHNEFPSTYYKKRKMFDTDKIPEKYRDDFRMVWKQAHDEQVKLQEDDDLQTQQAFNDFEQKIASLSSIPNDEEKVVLKKFYRVFVVKYNYRKLQMRIGECCISKLE